jgi:signal peptidase I
MAKKSAKSETDEKEQEEATKKPRFRDTWQGFVVFVAILLALRFLVFEPFKIPTGSMEPTLLGHEDHGDRIVTNKMAYRGGTNPVAFFGGDPKRFEVFVFVHDSAWGQPQQDIKIANSLKRNYIKRVVGLPGETIVISGGDLFLRESGKERVLRKWEADEALQRSLWQPVSVADLREIEPPPDASELQLKIHKQKQNRAFPWDRSDSEKVAWVKDPDAIRLTGPVTLTYRHPVTNLYVKVGRWPFQHFGCPAAEREVQGESGVVLRDPDATSRDIAPYLSNHWSGVECPNCGQIRFPMVRDDKAPGRREEPAPEGKKEEPKPVGVEEPRIFPNTDRSALQAGGFWSTEPDYMASTGFFFYGGTKVVGDLKLELGVEVEEEGGGLELEVGSNLHRAAWRFSLGGTCPTLAADKTRHDVPGSASLSKGGKHLITLAFVDGTVLSSLDGEKNDPVMIDIQPADARTIESLARIRLHGQAQVKITRLNLYRDLFYTLNTDDSYGSPVVRDTNDWQARTYSEEKQRLEMEIPENKFMALGDNSPSSVDSRKWGFVPRENLVGRASFVFWPPSRWRIIR